MPDLLANLDLALLAVPVGLALLLALLWLRHRRRAPVRGYGSRAAALAQLAGACSVTVDARGCIIDSDGREAVGGWCFRAGTRLGEALGIALPPEALADSAHRAAALPIGDGAGWLLRVVATERPPHGTVYVCALTPATPAGESGRGPVATSEIPDAVTGLMRREAFVRELDACVAAARHDEAQEFVLCFVGLDRFATLNRDLGFEGGDAVLRATADRLRAACGPGDRLARLGGDEFGLIFTQAGPEQARGLATRLLEALGEPLRIDGQTVHVAASIGVSDTSLHHESGARVLAEAASALVGAKRDGGGRLQQARPDGSGADLTRLESELREALARDRFVVRLQPVIDLDAGQVYGFEALVRWEQDDGTLVGPASWIEFAEEIGLAREIDRRVLDQSLAAIARIQRESGRDSVALSVNLGDTNLQDQVFMQRMAEGLREHRLDPATLRLELLERVIMNRPIQAQLEALREAGVGIYVDDFGTGYSSLSRLQDLPLTGLKIDREFVRGLAPGGNSEKIVRTILSLARELDLLVVAEGAGSAREARRLEDLGCPLVQGFYFSEPIGVDDALDWVRHPESRLADKLEQMRAPWRGARLEGREQAG